MPIMRPLSNILGLLCSYLLLQHRCWTEQDIMENPSISPYIHQNNRGAYLSETQPVWFLWGRNYVSVFASIGALWVSPHCYMRSVFLHFCPRNESVSETAINIYLSTQFEVLTVATVKSVVELHTTTTHICRHISFVLAFCGGTKGWSLFLCCSGHLWRK